MTIRLRWPVTSMPLAAMTETTSGGGGRPPPSSPAEATGTATPHLASRADSMACAMTDRQTLAVQSRRISDIATIQSRKVKTRVLLARNQGISGGQKMSELGAEPTLRGYLRVMRRGRWWVAAFSLLGLGISLALSLTATKQYAATAQLLVQSVGTVNIATGSDQALTATDVQTELQLVTSAQVQNQVRAQLGSAPGVSASEVGQTNVIGVTAVSPDPARAAQIANAYASAFVSWSTATSLSNLTAAEGQLTKQINVIGKRDRQASLQLRGAAHRALQPAGRAQGPAGPAPGVGRDREHRP